MPQEELREGIEQQPQAGAANRRFLIALSESDGASPPKDDGPELAK